MKKFVEFLKKAKVKTSMELLATLSLMICVSVFVAAIAFLCIIIYSIKNYRESKIENHESKIYDKLDTIVSSIVPDEQ